MADKTPKATAGQIADVVANFDENNATQWTQKGEPAVPAIIQALGLNVGDITRAEVNAATKRTRPTLQGNDEKPADNPAEKPKATNTGDRVLVRIIESARVHLNEPDAQTANGKDYVLVCKSTADTLVDGNLAQMVREPRPDELALAINAPAETA